MVTWLNTVAPKMSAYFPEVAKLLVHADIVVKKMTCWFIGRHCSDSNQALLVLNSLFGFVKQPNPILRVLALRTLSDILLENHLEFVLKLVGWSVDILAVWLYKLAHVLFL